MTDSDPHKRIIVSYAAYRFRDAFWQLEAAERASGIQTFCAAMQQVGDRASFYQVYPARAEYDVLVWTTSACEQPDAPDRFLGESARRMTPLRRYLDTPLVLCGITKPSIYVRQRQNPQEVNPYDDDRKPYFVIYPFSKTADWYFKSKEERQQLMTAHIRLGMSYPAIKQLLLYSFGIQDQEFIVAYEMDDLPLFSDLVQELRSTEARAYTLLDTPIVTGLLRTPDQLAAIFGRGEPWRA